MIDVRFWINRNRKVVFLTMSKLVQWNWLGTNLKSNEAKFEQKISVVTHVRVMWRPKRWLLFCEHLEKNTNPSFFLDKQALSPCFKIDDFNLSDYWNLTSVQQSQVRKTLVKETWHDIPIHTLQLGTHGFLSQWNRPLKSRESPTQ